MEYKVSFLGHKNGKTYKFEMCRDSENIRIKHGEKNKVESYIDIGIYAGDDVLDEVSIEIEALYSKLKEYHLKQGEYKNSELAKTLLKKQYPEIVYNLFRTFAQTLYALDYTENYVAECNDNYDVGNGCIALRGGENYVRYIINAFKSCYDRALMEMTGSFGRQPLMYLLKKMDDERDSGILSLYNMGLLHKIEAEIEDNELSGQLRNYYVHFDVTESPKISEPTVMSKWRTILLDMKEASSKFGKTY